MTSLQRYLRFHGAVVIFTVLLLGWWFVFFETQGDTLLLELEGHGIHLDAQQAEELQSDSQRTARMFLLEGLTLGVLLILTMGLVRRAIFRERDLERQQRNFLSAVTHELRSPIASSRLYLESILMGRADSDRQERYLRHAHDDLHRLGDMVDDLLDMRRFTEVGVEIAPVSVDLAEELRDRWDQVLAIHGASGATLTLRAENPVPARVDLTALERIVNNLVSNAVKYGGAEPDVTVTVKTDGDCAVLTVRDHGEGLKGADREDLLGAFVRGGNEDVRTQQGTGLGLFLVHQLVEAHGGEMGLSDDLESHGTLVTVRLPPGGGRDEL